MFRAALLRSAELWLHSWTSKMKASGRMSRIPTVLLTFYIVVIKCHKLGSTSEIPPMLTTSLSSLQVHISEKTFWTMVQILSASAPFWDLYVPVSHNILSYNLPIVLKTTVDHVLLSPSRNRIFIIWSPMAYYLFQTRTQETNVMEDWINEWVCVCSSRKYHISVQNI